MAVLFDDVNDTLSRTSGFPDWNSPYTWMAWICPVADNGQTMRILTQNPGANATPRDEVLFYPTTLTWELRCDNLESGATSQGSVLTLGTWYHVALVRTSVTQQLGYLDGVLDITLDHADVTGRTAMSRMDMGGMIASAARPFPGKIAFVKYWERALTQAEVAAERLTIRPISTTNIWGWWPLFPGSGERARDYSANGRNWTENGTLTDEYSPPISWGAPIQTVGVVSVSYQFARPTSDISAGGWTTTPLFSKINETTPNDSDIIRSVTAPSADVCEVELGTVSDPVSSSGHIIRYRARKAS